MRAYTLKWHACENCCVLRRHGFCSLPHVAKLQEPTQNNPHKTQNNPHKDFIYSGKRWFKMTPLCVRKVMQKPVRRIRALWVGFLLKTDSGNPKDAGVNIALVDPGNPLRHDTVSPRSAHQSPPSPIKGKVVENGKGFRAGAVPLEISRDQHGILLKTFFFAN